MLLGVSSGILCPCYLASIGYFQAKFQSELFFGAQITMVVVFHTLAAMIPDWCDFGPRETTSAGCLRLAVASILSCVTLVLTPACSSESVVLLNGAVISALSTFLFGISNRLAAPEWGNLYVKVGFTMGSLIIVLLMSLLQLGPGSAPTTAFGFYGLAAAICVIGAAAWICWRAGILEPSESLPFSGAERGAHWPWAHGGASNTSIAASGVLAIFQASGEPPAESWLPSFSGLFTQNSLGMFLSLAIGFALFPLLTMAGPWVAGWLYAAKLLGDFLGRIAAIWHSLPCTTAGHVGMQERMLVFCMIVVRFTLGCFFVLWLVNNDQPVARMPKLNIWVLVLVIYASGGYVQVMLNLDSQLSTPDVQRNDVEKCSRFSMNAGTFVGLAIGFLILLTNT